jgi:hypothetical protein
VSERQSGRVDHDLLADYVGGALDGTAEERVVARLIAEDPQWAEAYARLAQDTADVRVTLSGWGAEPASMPPDVIERISAALSADLADGLTAAANGHEKAAGGRREPAVTGTRPGATRRPGATAPPGRPDGAATHPAGRAAARRLPRWAMPVAIVAVLAAMGGLGVSQLAGDTRATDSTASSGEVQPRSAEGGSAEQPVGAKSPDQVFASGTDYTRRSLVAQLVPLASRASTLSGAGESPVPAQKDRAAGEPQRDLSVSTLAPCLRAIAGEHGRGTPRFDVVDYARFEGEPALIVLFTDPDGQRWAWAVSPECGRPEAGAAARYSARVG